MPDPDARLDLGAQGTQGSINVRVTEAAAFFMGGLDTIVVSSGTGGRTPIIDTEPEEFQRIMDQNLRPVFLAVRYGVSHLLAAGAAGQPEPAPQHVELLLQRVHGLLHARRELLALRLLLQLRRLSIALCSALERVM